MDIYKNIGINIKKIRLEKKIGINDLAILTGLGCKYLESIEENGVPDNITLEVLSTICSSLDINILELFK